MSKAAIMTAVLLGMFVLFLARNDRLATYIGIVL